MNWVATVTTDRVYDWDTPPGSRVRVALLDGGVKRNIMRSLERPGLRDPRVPGDNARRRPPGRHAGRDRALAGPGRSAAPRRDGGRDAAKLIGKAPVLGICLGHQVAARALGAGTFKLPFGHRGGNHPVKDLRPGT